MERTCLVPASGGSIVTGTETVGLVIRGLEAEVVQNIRWGRVKDLEEVDDVLSVSTELSLSEVGDCKRGSDHLGSVSFRYEEHVFSHRASNCDLDIPLERVRLGTS